jgi:hypothetical protein
MSLHRDAIPARVREVTSRAGRTLYIFPSHFPTRILEREHIMQTVKIVLTDAARTFGLLSAVLLIPFLLVTFAPGVPRWIAAAIVHVF